MRHVSLSALPADVSARSAYICSLTGESRWASRGCRSLERWAEKPRTVSFSVLPLCSDSCSCVGVSPLSAPRANKKRKRQQVVKATREPYTQRERETRGHIHTGDVCGIRHRGSACGVRLVGWSWGTFHDFSWWVGIWSWQRVASFIYKTRP